MLIDENGKPKRNPWNEWYRTQNRERVAGKGVRFSSVFSKLLREVDDKTIQVGKGHLAPNKHTGTAPLNPGFDVNVAGFCIGVPGSLTGIPGAESRNAVYLENDGKRLKPMIP